MKTKGAKILYLQREEWIEPRSENSKGGEMMMQECKQALVLDSQKPVEMGRKGGGEIIRERRVSWGGGLGGVVKEQVDGTKGEGGG